MTRLFIAIRLPDLIKDQLLELVDLSLESASWRDIDHVHLTLKFVGEVNDLVYHDIIDLLADIQANSFSLVLQGVGFFPPRHKPNVLWIGVQKNDLLIALQNKIEHKLKSLDSLKHHRKFHPHITLARLHNPTSNEVGLFLAQNNLFKTEPFPITEFSLYSSVLSSHGATHTEEATYPLIQ